MGRAPFRLPSAIMRLYSTAEASRFEHKYAIQMAPQGKGYALFDPYPGQHAEAGRFVRNLCVEIGDVGYIARGSVHLLFNVHRDAGDPLQIHGVPRGFTPLRRNERSIDRRYGPSPRLMHSSSSSAVDLGAGASVPGIADASITWNVQHERGATLAYVDSHEIWDAQNKDSYRRYFRYTYKS